MVLVFQGALKRSQSCQTGGWWFVIQSFQLKGLFGLRMKVSAIVWVTCLFGMLANVIWQAWVEWTIDLPMG